MNDCVWSIVNNFLLDSRYNGTHKRQIGIYSMYRKFKFCYFQSPMSVHKIVICFIGLLVSIVGPLVSVARPILTIITYVLPRACYIIRTFGNLLRLVSLKLENS